MESSVNRDEFEQKLRRYVNSESNRCMWDRKQYERVLRILSDPDYQRASYYHFVKKYEILNVSGETHLILKRKADTDHFVYMIPYEDYYPKLVEAHKQTGHGGRDKMIYYGKNKWRISRTACEVFVKCCEICNRKRSMPQKSVVVKPILSEGFNNRGQVDLIDFQSCADGEYKWLMNFQDHATKFLHLRPLKSKHAANVADELFKIFMTFGAPAILQSDNGREFVAAVIKELVNVWPDCKIVHGRPRHPQTQGSVERANADVENMLRAWIIDNKSNNWSRGCFEVQWHKNTSKHRIINRTPYEALLGPIKCGLSTFPIPASVINNVTTEEQLEEALSDIKTSNVEQVNNQQSDNLSEENKEEAAAVTAEILSADNQDGNHIICGVCSKVLNRDDSVRCTKCSLEIHDECGELDLATEDSLICALCARGILILDNQKDCFERQKEAAVKMTTFSTQKFPVLPIDECVTVSVPSVDRGPLDLHSISAVVIDVKDSVYQVGTKDGLIKGWFPRTDIQKAETTPIITSNEVPAETILTLREAASRQSNYGGQGYKKCNCKDIRTQCLSNKCSCYKAGVKCGSRCHQSSTCSNK